jgi:hypothetical protein
MLASTNLLPSIIPLAVTFLLASTILLAQTIF